MSASRALYCRGPDHVQAIYMGQAGQMEADNLPLHAVLLLSKPATEQQPAFCGDRGMILFQA